MKASLLILAAVVFPASARALQLPLPLDKSVSLTTKESAIFFVEGRQTIPRRTRIGLQRGIKLIGRGEGATLVVEGSLSTVGETFGRVRIEGLTIELAPTFEQVRCAQTDFGKGASIRTGVGKGADGLMQLENAVFSGGATVNLEMTAGELRVINSSFGSALVLRGVEKPTKTKPQKNRTSFLATGSKIPGLKLDGVADSTLRRCVVGSSTIKNSGKLMFDACLLKGSRWTVEHDAPGGLKDTRFTKCDFLLRELILRAPASKRSIIKIDKPWFDRCGSEELIRQMVLTDSSNDKDNGAQANISKVRKQKNGFASE